MSVFFYSRAVRPEITFEKLSQKSEVETAGYMTAQQRIENMMLAGRKLVQYRREQFDFPDGQIDESFTDPTRSKNFDFADGTRLARIAEDSLRASQAAHNALKKASEDNQMSQVTETKTNPE